MAVSFPQDCRPPQVVVAAKANANISALMYYSGAGTNADPGTQRRDWEELQTLISSGMATMAVQFSKTGGRPQVVLGLNDGSVNNCNGATWTTIQGTGRASPSTQLAAQFPSVAADRLQVVANLKDATVQLYDGGGWTAPLQTSGWDTTLMTLDVRFSETAPPRRCVPPSLTPHPPCKADGLSNEDVAFGPY